MNSTTPRTNVWLWEEAVDGAICNEIVDLAERMKFSPAAIGDGPTVKLDRNLRDNGVVFLPRMHLIECVLAHYAREGNVNSGWLLDLTTVHEGVQVSKYDGNRSQFYGEHNDLYFSADPSFERKLTAILFLSDPKDYDGGGLQVAGDVFTAKPQGTIIVFPCCLQHEVFPVKRGLRYTATCWIAGPRFR